MCLQHQHQQPHLGWKYLRSPPRPTESTCKQDPRLYTAKHITGEVAPTLVTHTLSQIHWCRFCLHDNIAFFLRKRTMSYVSCTECTTPGHKARQTVSAFYLFIDRKPSLFVACGHFKRMDMRSGNDHFSKLSPSRGGLADQGTSPQLPGG